MIYAVLSNFDFVAKFTVKNLNKDFTNAGRGGAGGNHFVKVFQKIRKKKKNDGFLSSSRATLFWDNPENPVTSKDFESNVPPQNTTGLIFAEGGV